MPATTPAGPWPAGRRRRACTLRRQAAAAVIAITSIPVASHAQSWLPTSGGHSWFDAANWSGLALPRSGADVDIGAGGSVIADLTLGSLPVLGSLDLAVDLRSRGIGVLSVSAPPPSTFSPLTLTGGLRVGMARTGTFAEGSAFIDTNAFADGVVLGDVSSNLAGARAIGTARFSRGLTLGGGLSYVGTALSASVDSFAAGRLDVTGDAGSSALRWVGVTDSEVSGRSTGKRADGEINVSGSFGIDLAGGTTIGATLGTDRVVDPAAAGGFRSDVARGAVRIGDILTLRGTGPLAIGVAAGGTATGSLGTTRLAAALPVALTIGSAGIGGNATGSFTASAGDLATTGRLELGVGRGGNASGDLALTAGRLRGDGSELYAGAVLANGTRLPESHGRGTVSARSLEGYSALYAGLVRASSGPAGAGVGDGSTASGRISTGSGPTIGPLTGLGAGWVLFDAASTGRASAGGLMLLGTSVAMAPGADVNVGAVWFGNSAASATGTLRINGDLQGPRMTNVGTILPARGGAGSSAQGTLFVRDALRLDSGGWLTVGGTMDTGDRNGALFDTAHGRATIGSLVVPAGRGSALMVGSTFSGQADGRVTIGKVDGDLGRIEYAYIGIARSPLGVAHGELTVSGGTLKVSSMLIGHGSRDTDVFGRLALQSTQFTAREVEAGFNRAELVFSDVVARIEQDMWLGHGLLSLERSTLAVDHALHLGPASLLHVEVDGLRRGVDYGAIDGDHVLLEGALEVDFGDLSFTGSEFAFDLVRSASPTGIGGNFVGGVAFINVPAGYHAWGAQELDGVGVYRVHLAPVPEPASGTQALLGLAALAIAARRRSNARRWLRK